MILEGRQAKRYDEISDRIVAALRELGQTADDVAQSLLAAGIQGVVSNPVLCPVAQYLVQRLQDLSVCRTYVNCDGSVVTWYDEKAGRLSVDIMNPVSVDEFIDRFDGGAYPQLATRFELLDGAEAPNLNQGGHE